MPILTEETAKLPLPRFHTLRQVFDDAKIPDIRVAVASAFSVSPIENERLKGRKIALAIGSRGIKNLAEIVGATVDYLVAKGALPFIVPAMGSHGGATAAGQSAVLEGYGISESTMGVRIASTMETKRIADTSGGLPIWFSSDALQADLIIPIARIKPHTDFRGKVESGLCKMLAIGLGKHRGCSTLHKEGFQAFSHLIPEAAEKIIAHAPIAYGLAILENAYDQTAYLEVVPANEFLSREPALLRQAMANMPRIIPERIDILVIKEIGKDISGAGMDPNIIGRTTKGILEGYRGPSVKRIVVLGVSKASKGNAIGIGLADFTVKGMLPDIDYEATNANSIASGNPEAARVPIAMDDEEDAIRASISCTPGIDPDQPRIVRIKNTLELETIEISEALVEEARACPNLEFLP